MFVGANERSGTCRSAFQGRNNIAVECPYMQFCSARCPRLATTYIDSGLQYRSDCGSSLLHPLFRQDLLAKRPLGCARARAIRRSSACGSTPRILERNTRWGWELWQYVDQTGKEYLVIRADCGKGFTTPKPFGLRDTVLPTAGDPPAAHLGYDGRLIVTGGTHRASAASRGQQIPPDAYLEFLGGASGQAGIMNFIYCPKDNDVQTGIPLRTLDCPANYPHRW
jgi:hypothetical protein